MLSFLQSVDIRCSAPGFDGVTGWRDATGAMISLDKGCRRAEWTRTHGSQFHDLLSRHNTLEVGEEISVG
jgi:hypothetical protein